MEDAEHIDSRQCSNITNTSFFAYSGHINETCHSEGTKLFFKNSVDKSPAKFNVIYQLANVIILFYVALGQ